MRLHHCAAVCRVSHTCPCIRNVSLYLSLFLLQSYQSSNARISDLRYTSTRAHITLSLYEKIPHIEMNKKTTRNNACTMERSGCVWPFFRLPSKNCLSELLFLNERYVNVFLSPPFSLKIYSHSVFIRSSPIYSFSIILNFFKLRPNSIWQSFFLRARNTRMSILQSLIITIWWNYCLNFPLSAALFNHP